MNKDKKYPFILLIHGGPDGAFQNCFLPTEEFYPVATYSTYSNFILRPNYRGSLGYGAEFRKALLKNNGLKDY